MTKKTLKNYRVHEDTERVERAAGQISHLRLGIIFYTVLLISTQITPSCFMNLIR